MNATQRGTIRGGRNMLKEAAKQFRQTGDTGHAGMCEMHAKQLDDMLPEHCKVGFYDGREAASWGLVDITIP